ncbi:MAG: VOC family protein [Acidimicrobiales bacterium]
MDDPREPVERISAVTLVTTDMAASVAFYEALGFRVLYGGAGAPFTSLRVGSGFLNLQLGVGEGGPFGPGWGRIVFWVDDVDAMHARAVAAGLEPVTEPEDAPWGERYFHLRDPDGHELSFARPLTSLSPAR